MLFGSEPFSWQLPNEALQLEEPLAFFLRLRRFRSPVPASVLLGGKSAGAFTQCGSAGRQSRAVTGPYHASGNWWDENAWDRAEWDLELENGALCRCHEDGRSSGKSTEFMINDALCSLMLSTSNSMPAAPLVFCAADLSRNIWPKRGREAGDAGDGVARSQRRLWRATIFRCRARKRCPAHCRLRIDAWKTAAFCRCW